MHELRYGNKTVIVNDQCFWIIYTVYYKSHAVYRRTFANCACRICIIQIVSSTFGMIQVLRYNHIYPFRPSPTYRAVLYVFLFRKGAKNQTSWRFRTESKESIFCFLIFQTVTSRARSAVGQVSRSACRAQTRSPCWKTGRASLTVAQVSTVEKASATVKLTHIHTAALKTFSWVSVLAGLVEIALLLTSLLKVVQLHRCQANIRSNTKH